MVNLTLTDAQAEVFVNILQHCSNVLGRKICNDVDREIIESLPKDQIVEMERYFQGKDYDPDAKIVCNYDWALVTFFRMKLNDAIKLKQETLVNRPGVEL